MLVDSKVGELVFLKVAEQEKMTETILVDEMDNYQVAWMGELKVD